MASNKHAQIRFEGDDFMFRLTKDETDHTRSRSQFATLNDGGSTDPSSLRSQFATSNKGRGGMRYLTYAFTELGVAMLSSVLTSETAININRDIMRAFVTFNHLTLLLFQKTISSCAPKYNLYVIK